LFHNLPATNGSAVGKAVMEIEALVRDVTPEAVNVVASTAPATAPVTAPTKPLVDVTGPEKVVEDI
jgi:hypothetical protein